MSSGPYQPITDKFNPSLMLSDNDFLTMAQADNRYLRIGGAIYTSDIFASGSISGATISATSISGTLTTASQPNITSFGNLTALSMNGILNNSSTIDSTSTSTGSIITSGGVGIAKNLYVGTGIYGTLQTASQPNITSIGTLTTLNLNGSFNFGSNVNTTMNNNLIITGGPSSPTSTNGIGVAFNPLNSTGRIKAYNYLLSQKNRIVVNDSVIYITGTMDTIPDAVMFNTTNIGIGSKWTYHMQSSASNHLRINYSDGVYSDQWCSASGVHTFANVISASSYGTNGSALTFNDSVNITGSSFLSGVEHLALSYSQANHVGNIQALDSSGNYMEMNLGPQLRIHSQSATYPYSVALGGWPAISPTAQFILYQNGTTNNRLRFAYNTTTLNSELYCDGSSKLNCTTELNTKGINTGITNVPISAVINVGGDVNKIDVSTNSSKIMEYHGTHATPTVGYLLMSNGSASTPTNAMTLGTYSPTNINFYTNNTHSMTIASTGRVGIGFGNTSPAYPLDVSGYVSWSSGGNTAYWLKANVSGGLQSGSSVAFNVSAKFSDNILCFDSIVNFSDRRLKRNIQDIDMSFETYYNHCIPKQYDRIDRDNQHQIGFIAQSMMKSCPILVGAIDNKDMKKQTEDDPIDGTQLTFDYTRMSVVNCCIIRKLISQNQDLIKRIEELESKLSNK